MEPLVAAKKLQQETDCIRCIQCQVPDVHELVGEPSLEARTRFLNVIDERGECGDAKYPLISRRLGQYCH
jgi:hypothetical protein